MSLELKEVRKQVLNLFDCENTSELSDKILSTLLNKNTGVFDEYKKIINDDTSTDWLQAVYEYDLSERNNLSQDYTPKSLSKLLARLTNHTGEKVVYDCCSGSGSLTITKHEDKPNTEFILHELDTNVLPFLLFNLAYNNINALVVNGDVLTGEVLKQYRVTKGKKYGNVNVDASFLQLNYDTVVSNPPFNLKTDEDKEFKDYDLTIKKSNHNFSFILHCLEHLKDDGVMGFILPNGVLTNAPNKEVRQFLCENGYLDVVITCPDSMFENTTIPVTVLILSKKDNGTNVMMIDERQGYTLDIRDMKGELHMSNRTYHKNVKTFSDKTISNICNIVEKGRGSDELGHCKLVSLEDIKTNDFNLQPSHFIGFKPSVDTSRSYTDIVNDLNRVINSLNSCKLTINGKLLKSINPRVYEEIMENYHWFTESKELNKEINTCLQGLCDGNDDFDVPELVREDYFIISKKKNMMKFENQNKEEYTRNDMFIMLNQWWSITSYLRDEETRYLSELRDKLLPDLMTGKLNVENVKIDESVEA